MMGRWGCKRLRLKEQNAASRSRPGDTTSIKKQTMTSKNKQQSQRPKKKAGLEANTHNKWNNLLAALSLMPKFGTRSPSCKLHKLAQMSEASR
jgi:hypothetical protein